MSFDGHSAPVQDLCYFNGTLFSGSLDKTIRNWDTKVMRDYLYSSLFRLVNAKTFLSSKTLYTVLKLILVLFMLGSLMALLVSQTLRYLHVLTCTLSYLQRQSKPLKSLLGIHRTLCAWNLAEIDSSIAKLSSQLTLQMLAA